REFDPARLFRTNEEPGWGASEELPRPLWLPRGTALPSSGGGDRTPEDIARLASAREPDWSKRWTDRIDHAGAEPEAGALAGAITADAFAAWPLDAAPLQSLMVPTAGAEGAVSTAAPAATLYYLAGGWAGSPPPPHATGAARDHWLDFHPEWMPASSRA